ncbi:MAG: sterol desaturase family protein [Flavobacteriales bacterium]|nr:sterol desaturase family protein [Flavobacteriales bacterium]
MTAILSALVVVLTFVCMEFLAWATHKYVMHGFLWSLHRDHHVKDHDSIFERNDVFFLVFALPSMLLLYLGSSRGFPAVLFWVGAGILLYGICYFLVHEIFIHQRVKWLRTTRSPYFHALRRAHKIHHKHTERSGSTCFGMLVVPMRYFVAARRELARERARSVKKRDRKPRATTVRSAQG